MTRLTIGKLAQDAEVPTDTIPILRALRFAAASGQNGVKLPLIPGKKCSAIEVYQKGQGGLGARNPNQGQDVPAWLSLILAAHRVPLRGVRRESHRVIRSAANTAMSQARTS